MKVEHVEVLVEERSMEEALRILLPRLLPDATFQIHPSNGKPDLLEKLPQRLRGYRAWLPQTWRIVVVVDSDEEDCRKLKGRLDQIARDAGLSTRTSVDGDQWQVVNRLAIKELEAWFLGDMEAVREAYPRVSATVANKAPFRDPDAIRGGTWEAFQRILQNAGYFKSGYRKLEAAREIAAHMNPFRNRSRSFQVFRETFAAFNRD